MTICWSSIRTKTGILSPYLTMANCLTRNNMGGCCGWHYLSMVWLLAVCYLLDDCEQNFSIYPLQFPHWWPNWHNCLLRLHQRIMTVGHRAGTTIIVLNACTKFPTPARVAHFFCVSAPHTQRISNRAHHQRLQTRTAMKVTQAHKRMSRWPRQNMQHKSV